jgi:hypothetical protein
MEIWDTWLGFLGFMSGLVAAAIFGWSPMRAGAAGFAGGLVLVTMINVLDPNPAPCLQQSKRWDVLRAYSLKCPDPNANLLPKR